MRPPLAVCFTLLLTGLIATETPPAVPAPPATLHPALFLVGDSITKTGTPPGDTGPWGMGYEIIPFFDPAKIHVYNEGAGGRSSRSYREEGLWARILERIQPGDFVSIMFGHNDTANSANYPDRATITGNSEETVQVGVGDQRQTIHSYGWYLRQDVAEAKAKGATVIVCSPVPRNQWNEGKIKRGFDGYAAWAADAAKAGGALFIDLNTLAADRYDALGQEKAEAHFNDVQHTKKSGARINAESVIAGVRQLKDCPLRDYLLPVTTVWRLDQTAQVGGLATTVLGEPKVVTDAGGPAAHFNGSTDGIFVPANPLAGWTQFTVEILFSPEEGGLEAQRFMHIQDPVWRVMIETRLDGKGGWWLDTFLGNKSKGQPLIDPKHIHPTGRWYWAAVSYDGRHMVDYINGEKELEADTEFGPMTAGQISLGVRQNKVYWFKGGIREVRFHSVALAPAALQRVP